MKMMNFAFWITRLASIQPMQSHCLSLTSGFSNIFPSLSLVTFKLVTSRPSVEVIHHNDRREDRRFCPSYQGRLGFGFCSSTMARVGAFLFFLSILMMCCFDVCRLLILKKPCLCTKSCTKGQGTDEACHLV